MIKVEIPYPGGTMPIDVEEFMFPDGQPHVRLLQPVINQEVRITTRLVHPADFFYLLLVKEVLDQGQNVVDLDIRYMSGARMDRRIDEQQPFTLKVFAEMIRNAGFRNIDILDPHSFVTTALLDAVAYYPLDALSKLLSMPRFHQEETPTVIVAPDAGATRRVDEMLRAVYDRMWLKGLKMFPVVQGLKHRDPQTGKLSEFRVDDNDGQDLAGKRALILDDICDGGGTFVGLADVLRRHGAESVDLFVTHGIFSKGKKLEGIDHIFTTDSYFGHREKPGFTVFHLDNQPTVVLQ